MDYTGFLPCVHVITVQINAIIREIIKRSLHLMLTPGNFVDFQNTRLHYATAGSGPVPLLVFHGFGQDHQAFESWALSLEKEYRLFVFDLYFHGHSIWPGYGPLEKSAWKLIIGKFLEQEKISLFEVAGFSLGGKFALATLEIFPEKIIKIVLLAPDGIKTSLWYSLATYPIAIRNLFKSMILLPGRFYTMVKFLRSIGLVNKGMMRFAESQMDTEEKRKRVYDVWVCFRHLHFDIHYLVTILNQFQIPLLLIIGKYDKVIPVKNMDHLLKGLHQKKFEIIESGHNDLVEKAMKFLL